MTEVEMRETQRDKHAQSGGSQNFGLRTSTYS